MASSLDRDGNLKSEATGEEAVKAHFDLLKSHSRNQMVARISLYVLATVFMISAAFLVVFAPEGREHSTWIVAGALVIVAAGAAGFSSFAFKGSGIDVRFGRTESAVVAAKKRTQKRERPEEMSDHKRKYLYPDPKEVEKHNRESEALFKKTGKSRMPVVLNPDGTRKSPEA